jgi:H+/Cl- antiporter ClcA
MAVAILTGLGAGVVAIIVSSFLFYGHYARQFPNDTQNPLSALTAGVAVGIGVCAVVSVVAAAVYLVLDTRGKSSSSNQDAV